MKDLMWLLLILLSISCSNRIEENMEIKEATIVEMVLYNINDGINLKDAQKEIMRLNNFISKQKGFVSRNTSKSEDGQFLDIVYWTDLNSAKSASEKAMKDPKVLESFKVMDENNMIFKYFTIFNKN